MEETINYSIPSEIKLIDRSGNLITDFRNYKDTYVCINMDKSSYMKHNVTKYAGNKMPTRLPDNSGIFFVKFDIDYGPEWIDVTAVIKVLCNTGNISFTHK